MAIPTYILICTSQFRLAFQDRRKATKHGLRHLVVARLSEVDQIKIKIIVPKSGGYRAFQPQGLLLEGHSRPAARATGRRRSRAGKPACAFRHLARRPPPARRPHGGKALSGTWLVCKLGRASAQPSLPCRGVCSRGQRKPPVTRLRVTGGCSLSLPLARRVRESKTFRGGTHHRSPGWPTSPTCQPPKGSSALSSIGLHLLRSNRSFPFSPTQWRDKRLTSRTGPLTVSPTPGTA
jgi:hypothetical protein